MLSGIRMGRNLDSRQPRENLNRSGAYIDVRAPTLQVSMLM